MTATASFPRVLLVAPVLRADDALSTLLFRRDLRMETVESEADALRSLESDPPDAVILDLPLDGFNIPGLLTRLRTPPAKPDAAILALAPDLEAYDSLQTLGIPVGDILDKPARPERLAAKLDARLECLRLRRELALRSAEVEAANRRLEHLLDVKNRFLSVATHDIRTPVTTMKLVMDVLERQIGVDAAPGLRRLLDILERNLAKVEGKMEDLILISRLDLRDPHLEVRAFDLNGAVQDAIASFFPGAISRGVELDALLGEIPLFRGDPRRVGQLAAEMISCALDRLDSGDRVMVETLVEGEGVRLRVSDNGPRLPADMAEALLQGLEREEPTRQTRAALFAAYQIAKAHGGMFEIAPGASAGAVYSAWLPLRPPVRPAAPAASREENE